jgi:hypothetical protein
MDWGLEKTEKKGTREEEETYGGVVDGVSGVEGVE